MHKPLHTSTSFIYWITRCDRIRIIVDGDDWVGYAGDAAMTYLPLAEIISMLQKGLLTSWRKKDMKELKIQTALGTLCNLKHITLIPTEKAYKQFSTDSGYARTWCAQI